MTILERLLNEGVDPSAISSSLEFVDPLMDAIARRNRRAVAQLLVEEGADPPEESSVVVDAVARPW